MFQIKGAGPAWSFDIFDLLLRNMFLPDTPAVKVWPRRRRSRRSHKSDRAVFQAEMFALTNDDEPMCPRLFCRAT